MPPDIGKQTEKARGSRLPGWFGVLVTSFWVSAEKRIALPLLAAVVSLELGQVYLHVQFNQWNKRFYDSLQQLDFDVFLREIGVFALLAALFIAIVVYGYYLRQLLSIRWRTFLTRNYLDMYYAGPVPFRLGLAGSVDNPDQRIADDLQAFVDTGLDLALGLLSAIVTLVSFTVILWTISGDLVFSVAGIPVIIPGYMLWAAIVYAGFGTWFTTWLGRPLVGLSFHQEKVEADFRFSIARSREMAESISLSRGGTAEVRLALRLFGHVLDNFHRLIRMRKRLLWWTAGYGQLAAIFPVLVASPRYFSGSIQLGDLFQISSAFGNVQGALSFIINVFPAIARWRAVIRRLDGFTRHIGEVRAMGTVSLVTGRDECLSLGNLLVSSPGGVPLVRVDSLVLRPGEHVLVTGEVGIGKSTLLLRTLSGMWPHASGTVTLPRDARVLFLPQRPCFPVATLEEALCYPDPPGAHAGRHWREILSAFGLERLLERSGQVENWAHKLSPGEQQRLVAARAVLLRPDWLFMDEASAAMDAGSEVELYRTLLRLLPGVTLVSIGHAESLVRLHHRHLRLVRGGDGTGRLEKTGTLTEMT